MSRVASYPVPIPDGVRIEITSDTITAQGKQGKSAIALSNLVRVHQEDNQVFVSAINSSIKAKALSGTMRSLIANAVKGVSELFVKRLELRGIGYRAQVQGSRVQLALGYSNPVHYQLPEGVIAQAPSQTELHILGVEKQLVGEVAAQIRGLRPPEVYKGKGVRYVDEKISLKEIKKK